MFARSSRRRRGPAAALTAALTLAVALPAATLSADGYATTSAAYVALTAAVPPGGRVVPLVNSGEQAFGTIFEGIPDGIGVVPVDDDHIDLYVTHEQSHVPFPIGTVDSNGATIKGTADYQDSSVTRVRLQLSTRRIVDMDVALSPDEGFIRFCSAFMAGPEHGFADYTFLLNEESDDNVPVPAGAVYDSDPSMAGLREAGYTAWLNTADWTQFDVVPGMGRHNHENAVVIPGGWDDLAVLSGDDTFNAPSSQLYLYTADDAEGFMADAGSLWAFRVNDTNGSATGGAVDPADSGNHANDYLDISQGETFSGQFIPVPSDVARGDLAAEHPQAGLERWSNENNVFQFVRIEDIAYDPDDPRVVYFTDTGATRLKESAATGRLFRAGTNARPYFDSDGRVFKMVLNADDPTVVDSLTIFAQGGLREQQLPNANPVIAVLDPGVGFVNPDNLEVGHKSVMVQEDAAANNRVWQYKFNRGAWTHVASATQATAETSGIVDLSGTLGDGWWALDVQSHVNQSVDEGPYFWPDGQDANTDPDPYRKRREDGQLLLMFIPAS